MMITKPLEDFVIPMTEDLRESLSTAKTYVSLASMMISYAMYRCNFFFTENHPEMVTACATVRGDGNYIYLDKTCWEKVLTSDKQRAFVIYHEVMHIFLDHTSRAFEGAYHPELWNGATDFCINLSTGGTYKDQHGNVQHCPRITSYIELPDWVLLDEQYIGDSSDDIYFKILKEVKKEIEKRGGGKKSQDGESENGDGSGEGTGRYEKAFHDKFGKPLDAVVPSDTSNDEIRKQKMKNTQTIVAAATIADQAKMIGASEQALKMTIMQLGKPAVRWQDHLLVTAHSRVPQRSTYNHISRRSSGRIIFPTYTGDHLNVMFGIDSSGSMSMGDYVRCFTETVAVLSEIDSWDMWLVSCDTHAHLLHHISSEELDSPEDIDFSLIGGGGTDMRPLLDYAEELVEEGVELDMCIIMTDGYIPEESVDAVNPSAYHSVFLVTEGGNTNLSLKNHEIIFVN